MKYIYKLFPVFLGVALMTSCTNDAIDDLKDKTDDQAKRIAQLKVDAGKIETEMTLILDILNVVKNRNTLMVSAVEDIKNGSDVIGYRIKFNDNRAPIEILNGVTPAITIENNKWMINGTDWGLATGRDVVASDFKIPRVKNDGGFWSISHDDGATWVKTTVRAEGEKGDPAVDTTPRVTVDANNEWLIGGTPTGVKMQGKDAVAPLVKADGTPATWHFSNDNGATWINTTVPTKGDKGDKGKDGEVGEDAAFIESVYFDGNTVKFTFGDGMKAADLPKEVSITRTVPFVFNLKNGTEVAADFSQVFDLHISQTIVLEYVLDITTKTPKVAYAPKGVVVAVGANNGGSGKISISRQDIASEGTILLEVTDDKNQTLVRRIFVKPIAGSVVKIGDFYKGGIVFYVNPNGLPKIKTIALSEVELEWADKGFGSAQIGVNDASYGYANQLMLKNFLSTTIENVTIANFPAFKYCEDLRVETQSGWYMPAKDELPQMFDSSVVSLVNSGLSTNGGDMLNPAATYWSSTEVNVFTAWGYEQGALTPLEIGTGIKYKVRAVKAYN